MEGDETEGAETNGEHHTELISGREEEKEP